MSMGSTRSARCAFGVVFALFGLTIASAPLRAQTECESQWASLFPASTVVYAAAPHAGRTIASVLDHPLRGKIESLPPIQDALRSPQMLAAQLFIGILEGQLSMTWREVLQALTEKGLALGIDGDSQGVLIIARANNGETVSKVVRTVLGWVDLDARNNNRSAPYQMFDYRGHRIAQFPQFSLGRVDDWLVASNQPQLLRSTMDRLIDQATGGFAATSIFRQAAALRASSPDAWGVVDLNTLRTAGVARELLSGKTDNPAAELLVGGVLETLAGAPLAVAAFQVDAGGVHMDLSAPIDSDRVSAQRAFFFRKETAALPALSHVPDTVGQAYVHRDLCRWWQSKEELFDENVIAQLLQTDSQLSILFAGLDFGNDILGALQPDMQIIVARQEYDAQYPPELKLPSFALVGTLREPGEIKRRLRIAYQSVIGFANIQLAMEGYPQLDLVTESRDGVEMSAATYVLDARSQRGLVHYNFSPTLAFHGDRVILSSTRSLAETLTHAAESSKPMAPETNSWLRIEGPALAELLQVNRQLLVVQNMMEQGSNPATAEQNVDLLLNVFRWISALETRLDIQSDCMRWSTEIRFEN